MTRSQFARQIVALVAVVATSVACSARGGPADERDPVPSAALDGLISCGARDARVAAFWGSDEGVGFPDDSAGAPTGGDIWSITADGRVTALTDDARSRDPSLSDDGQRLYFTRSNGGLVADVAAPGTELWMFDLATGEQSLLFAPKTDREEITSLEESPDGTSLAFSAQIGATRAALPRVYTLELKGGAEPTVLPLPPADEQFSSQMQQSPTWSPDGARLAYVLVEGDNSSRVRSSLRVVDLATGSDELLYQSPGDHSYLPDLQWSRDGSAFLTIEKGGGPPNGFTAASIDAETGHRSVLVGAVPDAVTYSGSDGVTVSSIGLSFEHLQQHEYDHEPVLMTWSAGKATTTVALPVHLSFAAQLTIAACAIQPTPD